jgi:hypothetical protein
MSDAVGLWWAAPVEESPGGGQHQRNGHYLTVISMDPCNFSDIFQVWLRCYSLHLFINFGGARWVYLPPGLSVFALVWPGGTDLIVPIYSLGPGVA